MTERAVDWIRIRTPREQRMAVIRAVAEAHGCTVADVLGRSHRQPYARARQAAMAEVRRVYGDSASQIGRLFGRDHSTVLHALRKGGM